MMLYHLQEDGWIWKALNGNPLQYSCLENPMDIGAWQATVHGAAKSKTQLGTNNPILKSPPKDTKTEVDKQKDFPSSQL